MSDDKRLIEDFLPINAIGRESTGSKGHINTLHLWWARRPLLPCRAGIYGALVPVSRFMPDAANDGNKESLGRANAAKFVKKLCQYPGAPHVIKEAQQHILITHAKRLSKEHGKTVTIDDIVAGRSPRPRVLDMFAGGGAIPLEALRLGCEAHALDLNPVAHIIELCTLVYPQRYGHSDPTAQGITGPRNKDGETTWGGLASEVRYWADWTLAKVKGDISDLYPLIPDPAFKGKRGESRPKLLKEAPDEPPTGYLKPVAYIWTRTTLCKNPACSATVPLLRQTYLSRKPGRYVAAKLIHKDKEKRIHFQIIEARSEAELGFDPEEVSKGSNTSCPFCRTVCDTKSVMEAGARNALGQQLVAIVCRDSDGRGLRFLSPPNESEQTPTQSEVRSRLVSLLTATGLDAPTEIIDPTRPSPNARGLTAVTRYGLNHFSDLFTERQLVFLLHLVASVREATARMSAVYDSAERVQSVAAYLGLFITRNAQTNTTMSRWRGDTSGRVEAAFGRHALTMVWDYPEIAPFGNLSNDAWGTFEGVIDVINEQRDLAFASISRGSATSLPFPDRFFDAVVSDPPYYDNIPYADISDFFYVWLKRAIGNLFPEHFATPLTPKKSEATALSSRHSGDMDKASRKYEAAMLEALQEANRVLKPESPLVLIYAHKTTLGWSTMVDALRKAGFAVVEAWPLDTEMGSRLIAMESSALATSIFLVARKRDGAQTGKYEDCVRPELEEIVRERVATLWDMGISGADLVIACVGAGLRAFTRFARVDYANGEEVPAERFLTEVETVVLENILARLSKEVGGKGNQYSLATLDTASRFYVLWRYTYGAAELDAGEAIIFANGTHVELDGPHGLTSSSGDGLVEKHKAQYRLRDYAERGKNDKLGLPTENGQSVPLIDILHRTLWLMENRPTELGAFLSEAQPNNEQLRLVAQALGGPALKGGEMGDISPSAELSALGKLTANWQSVIENVSLTLGERAEKKSDQIQLL